MDELHRVAGALDRLANRIEAAESRSTTAIGGIEQSVHQVISRLDHVERAQVSSRTEAGPAETKALAQVEAGGQAAQLNRVTGALDRLTDRIETAESRSTVAIGGIEQSVQTVISRLDDVEREQVAVASRFEGAVQELTTEQNRSAERLRRIEQEAVGPRSAEALKALESALGKVAGHFYDGESRTQSALGALRQRLEQIEADGPPDPGSMMDDLVSRITQRLEAAEGRTSGAIRDLKGAFAALDERMRGVEGQAGSGVDHKLSALAASLGSQIEAARAEMVERIRAVGETAARDDRLDAALADVTAQVSTVEKKSAAALDKIGRDIMTVAETLAAKVNAVENRHADAVQQLGGEVTHIAVGMEDRLNRSDAGQAQALEKLGNEIARITERLSERVANAERRAAQAIDDVGEQVSLVSERLNSRTDRVSTEIGDRIRQSEERTARLLDEARERIDLRLAEAQRLAEANRRPVEPTYAAPVPGFPGQPYANQGFANPDFTPFANDPFAAFEPAQVASPFDEQASDLEPPPPPWSPTASPAVMAESVAAMAAVYAPPVAEPEPVATAEAAETDIEAFLEGAGQEVSAQPAPVAYPAPAYVPPVAHPAQVYEPPAPAPVAAEPAAIEPEPDPEPAPAIAMSSGQPRFSQVDFDAADALAAKAHADEAEGTPDFGAAVRQSTEAFLAERDGPSARSEVEGELAATAPPLSTREIIERARASARAASQPTSRARAPLPTQDLSSEHDGMFSGASARHRPPKRSGPTMPTALMVGGLAVAVVAGGVGLRGVLTPSGAAPPRYAAQLNAYIHGTPVQTAEADTTPPSTRTIPRVAVALSPVPIAPTATTSDPPLTAAPASTSSNASPAGADLYAQALAGIRSGDRNGLTALRRAATIGYPPAQFYLATLYSEGRSGVPRDLAQARIWTERAAQNGDRWAMHNLALNYYEGAGGHPNPALAAQWFRRAADRGLVDSQYNMGRLYETGVGVSQNPAEAYKWYLIAARSGDADSRASASRVRAGLSAQARAAAERAAAAYRPTAVAPLAAPPPSVAGTLNPAQVIAAQQALSRLRYLQGPADGVVTPALGAALSAFQRDHSLPVTSLLDPPTLARLQADAP